MSYQYKGIIFDINGILEYQGKVYPQAITLVQELREKNIEIRVLSNATLKSRYSCAEKLNKLGFDFKKDEIITASYASASYLHTLKPKSCWVMLQEEGLDEFKDFTLDTHNPEYIVMGDFRDGFNFQNMNRALQLILKGSKLIAMIPKMVDSSIKDTELTVGAYARMLELASGIKATYIGKPNKYAFDMCLKTMSLPRNQVLMVGDRLHTDILGAKNSGLGSVLIKAGEFREEDLKGKIRPDYCFEDISQVSNLFCQTK